jgi:hypothetical protein
MKKFLLASLLALPLFWGCQKETTPSTPVKPTAETTKTLHCTPYRDVYGYTALCSELNSFSVCNSTNCTGSSVTTSSTNTHLQDPGGTDYLVSVDGLVTATQQSEIMSQASSWATANLPSGYFVSAISYQPTSPGLTNGVNLTIVVTYRQCTGGGGGPVG